MHLHAVRLFVCPAIYTVRKRYSRIVITYWGSDLYRSSRLQLFMTLPILHSASEITMITNDMASYFKKLAEIGNMPDYDPNSKKTKKALNEVIAEFAPQFAELENGFRDLDALLTSIDNAQWIDG